MRIIICLTILLASLFAIAVERKNERLGELQLKELNLKPRIRVYEPKSGGFEIGESSVAFGYELKPNFQAVVRLGDKSLINVPSYFYDASIDQVTDFGFIESYAAISGSFGTLKMGLIPIEYDLNGEKTESEIILPRPMIYTKKIVAIRDLGLIYKMGFNRFHSKFSLHNGEAGKNKDGRIWISGKWSYIDKYFKMGLTGQVGETTVTSTSVSKETRGAFDATKNSKVRLGGLFLESKSRNINAQLEYYFGEIDVLEKAQGQFAGGVFNVDFDLKNNWSIHLRLDIYDPLRAVEKDKFTESIVGISRSSEYLNSVVSLVAIKKEEESSPIANDELLLTWKLSP